MMTNRDSSTGHPAPPNQAANQHQANGQQTALFSSWSYINNGNFTAEQVKIYYFK
jgi:hypothetical protein